MPVEKPTFEDRGFDQHDPLTALSPLDGRYFAETKPLREYSSELALMSVRTEVESKYLIALCDYGVIPGRSLSEEERERLEGLGPSMTIDHGRRVKEIEKGPGGTDHDLASVVVWMKEQLKGTSLEDLTEMVHFGLTSEDIDNLTLRLLLQRATDNVYIPLAEKVAKDLFKKADDYKSLPIMGRTHGQDAAAVTFGHEFAVYGENLVDELEKLKKQQLKGKLNGGVGVHSAHYATRPDVDWIDFSKKFVESLGFEHKLATNQTNPYHDVIERIQIMQRAVNEVHNMDQNMWRYISDDWLAQKVVAEAFGSSTFAQKVNPINFENSEGHAEMASGNVAIFAERLPETRLQRDLSDSSMRRYIVPNVMGTCAIAFINARRGLEKVYPDGAAIDAAISSNWAVMAEWAQQRMRVAGVESAYGIVKEKVRGVKVDTREKWADIIYGLPIEIALADEIMSKSPSEYVGLSVNITEMTVARGVAKLST